MTRKIIDPKNPPVLWSTVKDAFQDINANFQELYENGIGGNVDLSAVSQNIVPDTTEARGLGTTTKRWKDLYLSGDKIDLGGAIIRKAEDGGVAVPGLSTVRIQPFDVLLHESPAAGPYTGGTPVIIDKVTYTIATDPAFAADRDYVPTTYAAVLDEGNNIVDITVTNPSPYKQNGHITESEYSALNRSQGEFNNMYALPPGTNIDDWDALLVALATAVLPYGLIPCTVVSRSVTEVVGGIGVQGTQGTQGTQGIQGTTGAFAGQGIQGVQGASGPQGIQGTFGPQGIQGPQGVQGAVGAQGIQGVQGIQGRQGIQGSQGGQGIQGSQGAQGIQGVQGTSGAFAGQGIQGVQGPQGLNGSNGTQGIQGTTGAGSQGIQGIQGFGGNQGIQGVQGITGSGAQGVQGIQGIQGRQGIQGNTGAGMLSSRTTVAGTATNLANAATANVDITGYKGYVLYKIQTTHAAWIRIYTDAASRTADASRLETVDPSPSAGILTEIITTGADTVLISPAVFGFNNESPVTTTIPISITNKSGSLNSITVTLTLNQAEV